MRFTFRLSFASPFDSRWHDSGMMRVMNVMLLTPEEDSVGDPDEDSDEIDDLLPADLWFRTRIAPEVRP
jgi:hypothetical protein